MRDEDDASKPDNLWYYLTRGHLIAVQEAAIVRHEIPVIISFRWLKRHDGNGDFLDYGCLLRITNDTPRRFILYRIVFNVSVRHTSSSIVLVSERCAVFFPQYPRIVKFSRETIP